MLRELLSVTTLLILLAAPGLAAGDPPAPPLAVSEEPPPEPGAQLELPTPKPIERHVITESGASPEYYRTASPGGSELLVRIAPGALYRSQGEFDFTVDGLAAAWLELDRGMWRWALSFDLGYSFTTDGGAGEHLAVLGAGPALKHEYFLTGLVPRLVAGYADGFVYGVRAGLLMQFGWEYPAGLELGYRLLLGDESSQAVLATVNVDLVSTLGELAW